MGRWREAPEGSGAKGRSSHVHPSLRCRAVRPRLQERHREAHRRLRLQPRRGTRFLRRRSRGRAGRQATPRRRGGGHRCAEGCVAPRRRRRRRQDGRRRGSPRRDPAGLLQGIYPRRQRRAPAGRTHRGRHGVPAAHRPRRAGALPHHRRDRDPAFRPHDPGLAPGAGRHLGHRRQGQRDTARDRADPDRPRRREARQPRVREAALHPAPSHGEGRARREHRRVLRLLALLPVGRLQGHVPRRAPVDLLSRPARRALHLALRDLPPALFDQHLPAMEAGAALPRARAQRRDQHHPGQRQLDEEPRGTARARDLRPLHRGPEADRAARRVGFVGARQRVRAAGARPSQPADGQDDDDSRGLGHEPQRAGRSSRHVQLRERRHGAVGRAGRHRRRRRQVGAGRARPQRPAADALRHDVGEPADRRLRGRHGAAGRGQDRREGPPRPRRDAGRRYGPAPGLQGPRAEGHAGGDARLCELDRAHGRARFADPPGRAGHRALPGRRIAPPPVRGGLVDRGPRDDPPSHGRGRQGGCRLDGRRRAARCTERHLSRHAPLLPAELQPGDEPADRLLARAQRDDDPHPAGQSRQHPRRDARPERDAVAAVADRAQRRVRGDAQVHGRHGRAHRLHLRSERRPRRDAPVVRAHLQGGRGRRAQRLPAHRPDRRQHRFRPRRPADDPGGRRRALLSGAPVAADLHVAERALGRVPRRALCRRHNRRRRDDGESLPRRGDDRGPPCARPVRQAVARPVSCQLQEGAGRGPAQGDVQDGHLGPVVLSRRLQLRGGRPVALAGRRVLPRHALAHLRHRPARRAGQDRRAARARLRRGRDRAADRRLLQGPPRRRPPQLRGRADPHAAGRGEHRILCEVPQVQRGGAPPAADQPA